VLIIAGPLLMWLAPEPTFTTTSGAGLALLIAGIVPHRHRGRAPRRRRGTLTRVFFPLAMRMLPCLAACRRLPLK